MQTEEIIVNRGFSDYNPLLFGMQECSPGHSFGPHVRGYWLLHYICSGTGIFRIRGKEYRIQPGEIFVIPPEEETYYEADRLSPWTYIWIGFTANAPLPEAFGSAVIRCPEAEKLFHRMQNCRRYQNGKNAFLCSCLWELVSVLSERTQPDDNYALQAQSIMDSEYMNDLTIAGIADFLNISRSYLFSVFKKQTGLSPEQYLVRVRLERAAELMTVCRKSITLSAFSVGYHDIYHFSRIFKQYFGLSPRAYCAQYEESTRVQDAF